MKQIFKKVACLMLAVVLVVPVLHSKGLKEVKASDYTELNISETIIDKGKTVQLSVLNAAGSTITWSSEDTNVATVDSNGLVTGVDKGNANIIASVVRAGSTYNSRYTCELGVKTSGYLPKTPNDYSYLVGKDIKAGQYVIFSNNEEDFDAYWAIKDKTGKKIISNAFTRGTAIITVAKNQRLSIGWGYAVPINKVAKSTFKLSNLNKGYDFTAKVGYGFNAGTYKVSKAKGITGSCYAIVYSSNKMPLYKYKVKYYFGKNSYKITVKKGQYLVVTGGTIKKVK
jgi:hypothetical protein